MLETAENSSFLQMNYFKLLYEHDANIYYMFLMTIAQFLTKKIVHAFSNNGNFTAICMTLNKILVL